MEIIDTETSEFQDVVLEKCKVLEEDNINAVEANQSPHIAKDLPSTGTDLSIEDVNKCSKAAVREKNLENSPSTTNCSGNDAIKSQITSAFEENINSLGIPETPSGVNSDGECIRRATDGSLQNESIKSISDKNKSSCETAVTLKDEDNSVSQPFPVQLTSNEREAAAIVSSKESSECYSNADASDLSVNTFIKSQKTNPEEGSSVDNVTHSPQFDARANSETVQSYPVEEASLAHTVISPSSSPHLMSSGKEAASLVSSNENKEWKSSKEADYLTFNAHTKQEYEHSDEGSSVDGTQFPSHARATTQNATSSPAGKPSPAHSDVSMASPLHFSSKSQSSSLVAPPTPPPSPPEVTENYKRLQEQLKSYESQVEQLKKALSQKDNTITLYQRENALLEKEKTAFRKEKEIATKEKESIVITFATKEKSLIDAKKQKESIEKQLADSRKEVKNISTKFHALNEEKSRITYMLDEKCNEVKKFQKELEKQKTEYNNLEMKLKWNSVKLAQETEAKLAMEKKLEEERNAPKPHEEKANEKLKVEYEATAILLKHEIEKKDKIIETLTKDNKHAAEKVAQLQESMSKEILENTSLSRELECLRQEHAAVQNSYSEEMLNSAKLRGQLEELQVLRTQHTLNEDKISTLNANLRELEDKVLDSTQDLEQLQAKEQELLSINKEMSEMIVGLQNEICLKSSKVKGVEAENEILKKEKLDFDTKYNDIESQLKQEIQQKNDERLLLTKHLSEKTKMYESVKTKLENAQGDLEATKKKHSQVVKELQRELQKYKKFFDEKTSSSSPTSHGFCRNCELKGTSQERIASNNSRGSNNSRSDSESEAQSTTSTMNRDVQGPSKQHLVERILRLQQASARQTEKIDFLENHTLSLVAELQKKSKVVQYYMMRDQAGALTSSKSDQNKSELAKYGGVMSAIYSGIKGPNQSMTLELSLEINKKLQAVLEDTLLKNITLKENLDVLGLEVDKLTRKLAQLKS